MRSSTGLDASRKEHEREPGHRCDQGAAYRQMKCPMARANGSSMNNHDGYRSCMHTCGPVSINVGSRCSVTGDGIAARHKNRAYAGCKDNDDDPSLHDSTTTPLVSTLRLKCRLSGIRHKGRHA